MRTGEEDRYELRILGTPDLRAPDGRRVTSVLSQPSRLSLLAYLTLAPGPVTRSSVVADFWPESDEARARNALSQAVFYLRRSLGKDTVRSVEGDRLWVPPERVWCDARELLTDQSPSPDVVAGADGDLLAGWNADGSQPLQEWLDVHRRRARERGAELAAASELVATSVAPAVARPSAPASGEPPRTRRTRRLWWRPVAVAGLAAVLLAAALSSLASNPTARTRLVVLLPRVTLSAGAPELQALDLHSELVARLPAVRGVDVIPAATASTSQELNNQLHAIGIEGADADAVDAGDWVLEVSVRVTSASVHLVALIVQGPGYGVLRGSDVYDREYASPEEMAVDVPRDIAEHVAEMVGEVIET